jgi:hypothetical protein
MNQRQLRRLNRLSTLVLFGGLAALAAAPAQASVTISESISQSVSAVTGSISDSVKRLSDSSSKRNKVEAGDYKVMEIVADAQERPGMARVKLQPVASVNADAGQDAGFFLYLPRKAFEAGQLAVGGVVTARERPYGTEFASAATQQAFFLVMQDDWYRELASTQVTL